MPQIFGSMKFPKMKVWLYEAPVNPERIIAYDYLKCISDDSYITPDQIPLDYARKIAEDVLNGGHTPALESINLLFSIDGISKVVSHQIVRHRIGVSIGQRTQRANCEKYLGNFYHGKHYVLPPSVLKYWHSDQNCMQFEEYLEAAENLYNELIEHGVPMDDARYIIPQASETSMSFKVIYKSLQMACSTRLCHMMQGEIVEIFRLMVKAVKDYNGLLGRYLKPICAITGKCNRNENNPDENNPKGVCEYTVNGFIPVREYKSQINLTQYSKDNTK